MKKKSELDKGKKEKEKDHEKEYRRYSIEVRVNKKKREGDLLNKWVTEWTSEWESEKRVRREREREETKKEIEYWFSKSCDASVEALYLQRLRSEHSFTFEFIRFVKKKWPLHGENL